MNDPLSGTPWSEAALVSGFAQSPPNHTLMEFAAARRASGARQLLDIGCGAGRNAVPLVFQGWTVAEMDLSLGISRRPARAHNRSARTQARPGAGADGTAADRRRSMDVIVAHGIWNLAQTTAQFRAAVREAARVARPGGSLFVFTFSRSTLPDADRPLARYVYARFSGGPQIFLTVEELVEELAAAGFWADPSQDRGAQPSIPGRGLRGRSPRFSSRGPSAIQGRAILELGPDLNDSRWS